MAAWSDHEYRDDVLEDFGQHVRVSDEYDWDGSLEGGRPGSAAPAPSEIHSLADRIQVSLDEGDRIIVALDATLAAETRAELGVRDTWAEIVALAEQLDAA